MSQRFERIAGPIVLVGSVLLFADLFLDWRNATVDAPLVHVNAGSSGWAGWGVVAGILVAALIAWEGMRLMRIKAAAPDAVSALFAVGTLVFVVVRFFEDATNVDIAGVVSYTEAGRQWPAWCGLVLAVVVAGAAVGRAVPHIHLHHGRPAAAA